MIVIFWSCRNKEEAKTIINDLLEKRLIACASIFPVASHYIWKNKMQENVEMKVMLKTVKQHFEEIQSYILKKCSYEVPEILQVDVVNANSQYLTWVIDETI